MDGASRVMCVCCVDKVLVTVERCASIGTRPKEDLRTDDEEKDPLMGGTDVAQ